MASGGGDEVKMTHGVAVSSARAAVVQRAAEDALLRARKLALVLDLDETLVSTSHEPLTPQAAMAASPGSVVAFGTEAHRIELRPHLAAFLNDITTLFEPHLYTFGNAEYAREALRIIDPTGLVFRGRVVARETRPDERIVVVLPDRDG